MISVDISNVWGAISLPELLTMEKDVAAAHMAMPEGAGLRSVLRASRGAEARLQAAARQIRQDARVCVVVGGGSAAQGVRAVLELLQSDGEGKQDREAPQILFAGNSLSTRQWNALTALLEGRDFALILLPDPGTGPQATIAFRGLRWLLERKYGTDEAGARIYAVTAGEEDPLHRMAAEEHWTQFAVPGEISPDAAVLSPAGLLPMAAAGVDIGALLEGAEAAAADCDLRSFENPLWLYAGVRSALYRKGKTLELLGCFEPGFRAMADWWQQLFAGAGGSFPVAEELPGGALPEQRLRAGDLMETLIRFDPTQKEYPIGSDWKDPESLKTLEGKPLSWAEALAFQQILEDHEEQGVPVLTMDCGPLEAGSLGSLLSFLLQARMLCAHQEECTQ